MHKVSSLDKANHKLQRHAEDISKKHVRTEISDQKDNELPQESIINIKI